MKHDDAGTELYVLATNFLLYIALVILTILGQRIYFPHTLPDYATTVSVSAVDDEDVAAEYGEEGFEDVGLVGGGGEPSQKPQAVAKPHSPLSKTDSSDGFYSLDAVFSGGADGAEDAGNSGGGSSPTGGVGGSGPSTSTQLPAESEASSGAGNGFLSSMVDFKSFDQERLSKKRVLTRLLTCAVGLNVSFLITGIAQERIITQPYSGGEYFPSSYGLVFLNRLGGFIISALLFYITSPAPTTAIVYEFSFPSVSNMLSSWCQYEALKYVSFPTQSLFKCFKLAPVMLMGKALGNKTYPAYDYAVAVMIGLGIALFMVSTEDMNFGLDSIGGPETWSGTLCGLMLLLFFLVFDSFTGQWQSRMFHRHGDCTPAHMMLMVNSFSLLFSLITLVHTKEIYTFADFLANHPDMHMHVVVFSVGNTIGQIFIFQTIRSFGAVVFAIVMNTRIILSILFSCLIYAHPVNSQGLFGLFIVFASVAYRIKRQTAGRLLKWREQQLHGKDWFHEVHEHMDM